MVVAFPRQICACFASRMAELNSWHGACRLYGPSDALQTFRLNVVPQAGAAGCNSSIGRNAGCLNDDETSASARQAGVVRLVPICNYAVTRAVLTHGRYSDAVAKGHIFQFEWSKQGRHAGRLASFKTGGVLDCQASTACRYEPIQPILMAVDHGIGSGARHAFYYRCRRAIKEIAFL